LNRWQKIAREPPEARKGSNPFPGAISYVQRPFFFPAAGEAMPKIGREEKLTKLG